MAWTRVAGAGSKLLLPRFPPPGGPVSCSPSRCGSHQDRLKLYTVLCLVKDIQRVFRGHLARRAAAVRLASVLRIQAWARMVLLRRHFLKLKNAAELIQVSVAFVFFYPWGDFGYRRMHTHRHFKATAPLEMLPECRCPRSFLARETVVSPPSVWRFRVFGPSISLGDTPPWKKACCGEMRSPSPPAAGVLR